ncbi:LOW QUALITY PROTEIN: DNA polymerase delta subunit 4 [Neosynchiropus ocellatus]
MTTKRGLITDSFKVVKKARRSVKAEKRQTPSPPPRKLSPVLVSVLFTPFTCLISADPAEAHQEVRDEELQKLRQFDLDWRFGPCTGISRLQRWERAQVHGLNPPEEIRYLLLQTHTDPEYSQRYFYRSQRSSICYHGNHI